MKYAVDSEASVYEEVDRCSGSGRQKTQAGKVFCKDKNSSVQLGEERIDTSSYG